MASRLLESFDHFATADLPAQWTSFASATVVAGGRGASSCLNFTSGGATISKTLDAQATWVVGCAFKTNILFSGAFLQLLDTATVHCDLRLVADGTLQVTRNGTVLGTTTFALSINTFYYVEMKILISDTVGTVDVWVNGVNKLSLTGQDTRNAGNPTANVVTFRGPGSGTQLFDDIYIFDGTGAANITAVGDCRVIWAGPTGAGTDVGWTNNGGAATKQASLATNPPDVTKYISTATVPDSFTGTFSAPSVTGPIKALQVVFNQEKDDATVCTIAPITRHAGVDTVGVAVAPSNGSYLMSTQQYDTNPGTGVAWVTADITADEFGIKRVT